MFFSLVSNEADPKDDALNYQLFLISKELTANQIAIMAATYKIYLALEGREFSGGADNWLNAVAKEVGHGVKGAIETEEKALEEHTLISARTHADRSGIDKRNCRLTDLGIKFCEHLINFETSLS